MQDVLIYSAAAALSTIAGGLIPLKMKVNRKSLLHMIAIAAGILIGISFLEIIPEAWSFLLSVAQEFFLDSY